MAPDTQGQGGAGDPAGNQIRPGYAAANGAGDPPSKADRAGGGGESIPHAERAGEPPPQDKNTGGAAEGTPGDHVAGNGARLSVRDPAQVGASARYHRSKWSEADFIRIVKECRGNAKLSGRVMAIDESSVRERIRGIPELAALYGKQGREIPVAPDELDSQLRDHADMPLGFSALQQTDADMVKRTERLIHDGLEKCGVAKETLDKIRTLRGIEVTGGQIIAQSVSDIYQLYYIELMGIPARRAEIRRRYLDPDGPAPSPGETAPKALTPMEKMFWQKADTELFEQMGKGLDRFISGTQVLLAMQRGKKKPEGGKKEKPAF